MKGATFALWLLSNAVALFTLACAFGCIDPKFRARQATRDERIRHLGRLIAEQESRRPRQIQWLADKERDLAAGRADHLEATTRFIGDRLENRRRWEEMRPRHEEWLCKLRDGRPECIPNAWANMLY